MNFLGDDPELMFQNLWEKYAVCLKSLVLAMTDEELILEIKMKFPLEIYSDVIENSLIWYKVKKKDSTAQIILRLLMKKISDKYDDQKQAK